MTNVFMLADWTDYVPYPWLQIPGLLILIGLIVFFVMYRRRQY
jgi:hypothetical protein